MDTKPLVSVIIPCYNVAKYVAQAIESIVNQSYSNLEILIVDDASTDNTLEIAKQINDYRIKVIEYKENTQKIGAVNDVLKLAKGDLVAFQDADDWSEPRRIEEQVKEFSNNPKLGVCFTKYRNIGKKVETPKSIALSNEELRDEFLKFGFKTFTHLSPTCCPSMMVKKEVVFVTGGYHPYFKGRVAEDIHWIYRILKIYEGCALEQPLYNYRIREGSLTQNQLAGENAKAAYTWKLLSKIIDADINKCLNLLSPEHFAYLKELELEACEETLVESYKATKFIINEYEKSKTFKIGKKILMPFKFIKQHWL